MLIIGIGKKFGISCLIEKWAKDKIGRKWIWEAVQVRIYPLSNENYLYGERNATASPASSSMINSR